jgi:hypothetical protein
MAGKGTTLQIAPADIGFLARRGARAHRGGGDFSRSAVLHRSLRTLRDVLAYSDPRKTRGLPEEMHRLAVRLLSGGWTLKAFEVEHLEAILGRSPELDAEAAAAGIEAGAFLAAIEAMSFAEKAFVVDQAVQEYAPAAAAASPEEA